MQYMLLIYADPAEFARLSDGERQGKRMVTDGPFAETKEHLGGYYLVEAKDLDEAIGIAARIPSARFGAVEVRPVRKIEH